MDFPERFKNAVLNHPGVDEAEWADGAGYQRLRVHSDDPDDREGERPDHFVVFDPIVGTDPEAFIPRMEMADGRRRPGVVAGGIVPDRADQTACNEIADTLLRRDRAPELGVLDTFIDNNSDGRVDGDFLLHSVSQSLETFESVMNNHGQHPPNLTTLDSFLGRSGYAMSYHSPMKDASGEPFCPVYVRPSGLSLEPSEFKTTVSLRVSVPDEIPGNSASPDIDFDDSWYTVRELCSMDKLYKNERYRAEGFLRRLGERGDSHQTATMIQADHDDLYATIRSGLAASLDAVQSTVDDSTAPDAGMSP